MSVRQTHFITAGPTELSYVQEVTELWTNQSATTHIYQQQVYSLCPPPYRQGHFSCSGLDHLTYELIYKNIVFSFLTLGFLYGTSGKEPACQCRRYTRCRFSSWVRKMPCRRIWQPTPVFLPGEFDGQRSLEGYNPEDHKESDMNEAMEHSRTSTLILLRASSTNTFITFTCYSLYPGRPSFILGHFVNFSSFFKT